MACSDRVQEAGDASCAMTALDGFDAVAYINTPRWQTSRLGLERIAELLERMGRPQDALRFVHVAGTNGKGSTCSYLASVLRAAGYKTGLFTSPYVECFEERIRVDGSNISRDDLTRATLAVRAHASAMEARTGEHPTEFELMTAVALEHFRAVGCDIVVLEVGLGGRLDSTNIIESPEASVICRIGLDHTALLGDTLAAVAAEKAGIVKRGAPVVSWPQDPEALAVVRDVAMANGCDLRVPDFSRLEAMPLDRSLSRRAFTYKGERFETQLLGSYQPANAALAIEATYVLRERGWAVSDAALRRGIAEASWPCRFEVVGSRPLSIVDGGHNPQGARALADSLVDALGGADAASRRAVFVMGVLADKDYAEMIEAVAPFARAFVVYAPANPRALSARDLKSAVEKALASEFGADFSVEDLQLVLVEEAEGPAFAVARARAIAGADGVVVAFGSLYSVADVKAAFATE